MNVSDKLGARSVPIKFGKGFTDSYRVFRRGRKRFWTFEKNALNRYMKKTKQYRDSSLLMHPDEAVVDAYGKNIVLFEKKFQQIKGSVDEKFQSGNFKLKHFKHLYPGYNIKYCYILSDFFRNKRYKPIIKHYSKNKNIEVLFVTDPKLDEKLSKLIP